ncbi:MAG: hypothetical protein OXU35_11115 [Acidobacteriota bacterium]|nr:hypothetical protein [Acidobacteriota bacterium]
MDSWELFRRLVAARSDDPLWGVLFRRCRALIGVVLRARFAGRQQMDAAALDDLSQDVMERLVSDGRRVIRGFAGTREVTFEVFIWRIAENILRDQFRHERYRRNVEQTFPPEEIWRLEAALAESPLEDVLDDPEAAVLMRELNEGVETVLRRISPDDRQHALNRLLYRLYFRDLCTIAQIARLRAVPLSASSVARRITLIKRALRTSFVGQRHRVGIRPAASRGRRRQQPGSR